jgi:hypothetical protein
MSPASRFARRLSGGSDRARVEHLLAYLGTLHNPSGLPTEDSALDTIAALLERAEAAERAAATSATEHQRAQRHADDSERRAEAAEQRAAVLQEKADNDTVWIMAPLTANGPLMAP